MSWGGEEEEEVEGEEKEKEEEEKRLRRRRISLLSLFTICFVFLSTRTGAVHLPVYPGEQS